MGSATQSRPVPADVLVRHASRAGCAERSASPSREGVRPDGQNLFRECRQPQHILVVSECREVA